MAVIGLEQKSIVVDGADEDEGVVIRVVEVCVVTNSTLERSFNLSLVVDRSTAPDNDCEYRISHSKLEKKILIVAFIPKTSDHQTMETLCTENLPHSSNC